MKSVFFDHINNTIEDDNLDTTRVGKGLDGYYYRLIVCKHNPPHTCKPPPEELPVYDFGDWKMLDRYKVGSMKLSGLTEEELEASYLELCRNFHRYKSLRRSVVSWLRYVANTISVWGFVRGMRTLSWALFNTNPLSPTMFLQQNWRYGSLFRCVLLLFLTMKRLRRQRTPRRGA